MKIVAVAACPYGIVYTYLSAAALEKYAKKINVDIKVETQGAQGADGVLTDQDIDSADLVLLTQGTEIQGMERFNGKAVLSVPIRDVIQKTDVVMAQAVQAALNNAGK